MGTGVFVQGPCIVASPHGGMNIEEVAEETPSEIYKEGVDIFSGNPHLPMCYYLCMWKVC